MADDGYPDAFYTKKQASENKKKADKVTAQTREEMAQSYGWALSVLKANTELWNLFNKAVKGTWTREKFKAELQSTKWFKKHAATWREDWIQQKQDPASWKQNKYDPKYADIQDMAATLGSHLTPALLNWMTRQALAYSWSDAQIRNHLANHVYATKAEGYSGQAATAEDELRTYAADMGVQLSDANVKKWLRSIIAQSATTEQYKGWIKQQAANSFAGLAQYIKQGQTVRQLADPYMQSMANILEINPASLTLQDPTIKRALSGVKEKDGVTNMMSLTQFEDSLRQDPRWLTTHNAKGTAADLAAGILSDFGLR